MNDYISRSELQPVDRTAARAPAPVQAVQPVSTSRAAVAPEREARAPAPQTNVASIDDDVASAAEYAEVHARIADILADLRGGAGNLNVDDAASAMQTMIPRPMVIVPLPPASKEAVEHAAVLAKRIVERAGYAHAAQAHVHRSAVDQIVSAA
ncbi:MAG: hypothetical protein I8H86_00635 [Sphingomonadaceae bacterium]|nr:hypothetical protein [Sphingomonadaceae bacterium]MBH1999276.1 hypothetical protein [Sphingomonadaceae bacterium]